MKSSPSHKVWTLFTAALKWVRHVPMFANLDICEQYSMLRCCWSDLFILIAAQYDLQIDSVALAYEIDTCTGMCNERILRLKQTLANFHECLLRLRGLEEAEYACLRVMVLFSSGEECKPNQPKTKVSETYLYVPVSSSIIPRFRHDAKCHCVSLKPSAKIRKRCDLRRVEEWTPF